MLTNVYRRHKHGLRTPCVINLLVLLCLVLAMLSYELSRRYAADDAPIEKQPSPQTHLGRRKPPKIALPYRLPLSGRHGKIDKTKGGKNSKHHKKTHHGRNESRIREVNDEPNHAFISTKHRSHKFRNNERPHTNESMHKSLNETKYKSRSNHGHRGHAHVPGRVILEGITDNSVTNMSKRRGDNKTKQQMQHMQVIHKNGKEDNYPTKYGMEEQGVKESQDHKVHHTLFHKSSKGQHMSLQETQATHKVLRHVRNNGNRGHENIPNGPREREDAKTQENVRNLGSPNKKDRLKKFPKHKKEQQLVDL